MPAQAAEPELSSWSASVRLPLTRADAWELMWRPEGQPAWLGAGTRFRLQLGTRWALSDGAGVWRIARPVLIQPSSRVKMKIDPATSWHDGGQTEATIRITDRQETGSVVRIKETYVPRHRVREVEQYWSRRLEQLRALAGRIQGRRKSVRQALVLIHGIGEQQPGETLRSLVDSGI